jgi:hypothetical protein
MIITGTVDQVKREEGDFIIGAVGGMGTRPWVTDPAAIARVLLGVMHDLDQAARGALRRNLSADIREAWAELAGIHPDVFSDDGSLRSGAFVTDVHVRDLVALFDDPVLARGGCWVQRDAAGAYSVIRDEDDESDPEDDRYDWEDYRGRDD